MACGAKGVYGRAIGTVRSKAEPWNERRVKNVNLGAKGDFRLKAVLRALNPREFSDAMKMALVSTSSVWQLEFLAWRLSCSQVS